MDKKKIKHPFNYFMNLGAEFPLVSFNPIPTNTLLRLNTRTIHIEVLQEIESNLANL